VKKLVINCWSRNNIIVPIWLWEQRVYSNCY